ncbi:MAG TPA: DUF4173 domain-containing protein [Clostridiaceae bacterium]|nr:DUF4173 domain-containing protein [Clostridiaceae bacterium]
MDDFSVVEVKNDGNENLLKKENVYLLVISLLLGIIFDILFYDKMPGISCVIFVLAFYAAILWHSRKSLELKIDFAWLLSIPVLMLALTYTLFSNEMFWALNFLGIPILVVVQTLLITKNNKYPWYTPEFIGDILNGIFGRTLGNITKLFKLIVLLLRRKQNSGKHSTFKKVLTGLIISIPLLLIIIALLTSADQVFEHFLGKIPEILENFNIGRILAHAIIIISISVFAFGYIWSLSNNPAEENCSAEKADTGSRKGVWDPVVIITILTTINIIYTFFVLIQFSYLFGSLKYGLPQDFTYSEYARRGFFELVAVTLINFNILIGCISFTKKGSNMVCTVLRILYSLLVFCTLVMLFSAHFRMSLYEKAYGYTYLRVLTHMFMAFLFVIMLITLYRVWNEKFKLLRAYIIVAVISYLIVNYMNVDVIIARGNIDIYFETGRIDVNYLTSLSYDAVPEITRLIDCGDAEVEGNVQKYLYRVKERLSEGEPWQSFNVSRSRARNVLSGYELHESIDGDNRRDSPVQ